MPGGAITRFADLYDFGNAIRGADVKALVRTHGDYRAELTRVDLHRVWIQHGRQSVDQIIHFKVPEDRSAVLFVADDDRTPTYVSGMEVSRSDLVCYSPGAEHHLRTPAGCHWLTMSLQTTALAEVGRVLSGCDVTAPAVTQVTRVPTQLMSRLRALHDVAARLAQDAPDILANPEVAKALEQELVRVLVASLTDPAVARNLGFARPRLAVMQRFERIIEASQDQPLYVAEVCSAIGVTDRTLRLHCQDHLGMSPHQYLWLRRMHLAQRALGRADRTTKTVTEIANDYGFGELGRFAVAYRNLFGESPSATLRRTL